MTSTVYIAKNVYGGDGIGRLGDGRVIFVPGAFAGENVKAEIVEEKKNYVKARLVEIVERNENRIGEAPPPVPGMVYSNLSYRAELACKEAQLAEFFSRARIAIPKIVNLTDPELTAHYRNKVVYHFDRRGKDYVFGYREEPSHKIVEIDDDPLAAPQICAKTAEIRQGVRTLLTQGSSAVRRDVEQRGNLTIRWSERSGVKWWIGDPPPGTVIKETTCGRVFEVPGDGFYQVNPAAGEQLVKAVVKAYREEPGDLIDLYCGVGVFGLSCEAPRLLGVESGHQAVEFARRNAAAQGVKANFIAGQVVRNLRSIKVRDNATVIVDPPRGGLERGVPEWLARSRARRIFYVSCDPATLMRDLRVITRNYSVASVQWINMFPRTARFETFVSLVRK